VNSEEKKIIMNKIRTDPNFKASYSATLTNVLYEELQNSLNPHYVVCQEPFRMRSIVIYSRRDFYLLEKINLKIEDFKSGGLIKFWNDQQYYKLKSITEQNQLESLNLEHFHGTFGIFCCGMIGSFGVFLIESLLKRAN
jgi:hypothetical protein